MHPVERVEGLPTTRQLATVPPWRVTTRVPCRLPWTPQTKGPATCFRVRSASWSVPCGPLGWHAGDDAWRTKHGRAMTIVA